MSIYRRLVYFSAVLTLIVLVVGAYVRLSDAGLGCPDWPGCYGQLTPAHATQQIDAAVQAQGGDHGPVSIPKAWKEMGHRYLAGVLGLCILAIAVVAWLQRRYTSIRLPIVMLVLLGVQATLGMWTVTLLLKPAIVTAHLLGGMSLLALLVWLSTEQWLAVQITTQTKIQTPSPSPSPSPSTVHGVPGVRRLASVALGVVIVQIALGGWVSTNYAALACPDLPLCRGHVVPPMDFANAFHVLRELGQTAQGAWLSVEALTAIHWTHRMFAVLVFFVVGGLAHRLARVANCRGLARGLAVLLLAQIAIGLGNVVLSLPLWLAAAHNAGAALLLSILIVINCRLYAMRTLQAVGPTAPSAVSAS